MNRPGAFRFFNILGILAGLLVTHSAVAAQSAEPGLFIDDGVALGTIVIPAGDDRAVERHAAADLQSVLHEMTGVELPIVTDEQTVDGNRILIGRTRFTGQMVAPDELEATGDEGYIVRLQGRDLALVGQGAWSAGYAVAELYDLLGARFYLPGELGAHIPEHERIVFDELDLLKKPAFRLRHIGRLINRDDQFTWNIRNRSNLFNVPDPQVREEFPDGFVTAPRIFHSQKDLLPQERYAEANPEYFGIVDGERVFNRATKWCNANPDVPQVLAENIAELLRENPSVDVISLNPSDWGHWCECPDCVALDDEGDVPHTQTNSRRQMVLNNRTAETLAQEFPDQKIVVGAYASYTLPPKDPSIKLHPNVGIMLCHFDREMACHAHPINDPNCPRNSRYLEVINAWREHTNDIYFFEYYWKAAWMNLPFPIEKVVAEDIRFKHSFGAAGVFTQHSTANIWTNFLTMYVAAQMLWDPELDVEQMLEEFYGNFYGEAVEPMREFHELLRYQMSESGIHTNGIAFSPDSEKVFTKPTLRQMNDLIDQAKELAEQDIVKRRVEKMGLVTEYTTRLVTARHLFRASQRADNEQERLDLLKQAFIGKLTLRNEVVEDRGKWDMIVSPAWFAGNYAPQRILHRWRDDLVENRMIGAEEYPVAGGTGAVWED